MNKILYIVLLCAVVLSQNHFTVDKNSIKNDEYKWSMKLDRDEVNTENDPIMKANVTIESLDKFVLHMKIVDANNQRWEPTMFNENPGANYDKVKMTSMGVELFTEKFGIKITDPKTNIVIVDTHKGSLEFKDKYLEITLKYPSQQIFGLGERVTPDFFLCSDKKACNYTLWGKDIPSPIDDGSGGCKGDYGQQPFYMMVLPKTKEFMGVYFHNSNDQDVHIQKNDDGTSDLTHRFIGGVFDMYFFYPGTSEFVMKTYHELIGRPYLPPLWALGYHQSKYGWSSLSKVKSVVSKFSQAGLPLDVVWGDIDYMKDYADFTVDPVRYAGLGDFVNELHKKKMHWVPIIDAGLKYDKNDKYYIYGESQGIFIKSAFTKKTLIGKVWPGYSVFISWYHPNATTLWWMGLTDFYKIVEYDGIWLDMNEVANFCNGECEIKEAEKTYKLRKAFSADPHKPDEFDKLPYRPGGCNMTEKTLSMTGYHYSTNDLEDKVRKEYNTHSLWSVFEAKATHEYFTANLNRRPFILTRANFPGSGIFASKWLGDNFSTWDYMRYSIPGIFNYQMFGTPLIGSDMCGFMGNTTEELCARWLQLGAFYPFTRNHNAIDANDQEPYVFGERVITATRNAMRQKYSIMVYYYTKLFEVSLYGGSLVRPMFFEFPNDPGTYEKTNFMFMIGSALLVAPALHEGSTKSYPYCTNENWYSLKSFKQVYAYNSSKTNGSQIELEAKFDYVNLLIIGGNIIPYQDTNYVLRIYTLKYLPMQLLIVPDHNGNAKGTMIADDGVSKDTITAKKYRYLSFEFLLAEDKLTVKTLLDNYETLMDYEIVSTIKLFGAEKYSKQTEACLITKNGDKLTMEGNYDSIKNIFTCTTKVKKYYWRDINEIKFGSKC